MKTLVDSILNDSQHVFLTEMSEIYKKICSQLNEMLFTLQNYVKLDKVEKAKNFCILDLNHYFKIKSIEIHGFLCHLFKTVSILKVSFKNMNIDYHENFEKIIFDEWRLIQRINL